MSKQLIRDLKFDRVQAATTSGTTTIASGAVSMANYEGVIFFTTFGTGHADNYLKGQQGAASNGSDAVDLAGTRVQTQAGGSNFSLALDIFRPTGAYVRCAAVRGSASTLEAMTAIRYNARKKPTENDVTDLMKAIAVVSPAAGTP
jgi:hypothetical protein